jgi:hypothetical protein
MSNILTSRSIDTNWSFAQIDDTGNPIEAGWGWLPTSTFPTTAHVELLKLGKIPDPVCYPISLFHLLVILNSVVVREIK